MVDLFGREVVEQAPKRKALASIERELGGLNYRPSTVKSVRCATCAHCVIRQWSKRYYKCELVGMSRSESTDIRANHVCDAWEQGGGTA